MSTISNQLIRDLSSEKFLAIEYFDQYSIAHLIPEGLINKKLENKIFHDIAAAMPGFKLKEYFEAKSDICAGSDNLTIAYDNSDGGFVALLCSQTKYLDSTSLLYISTMLLGNEYRRSLLLKRMWGMHLNQIKKEKGDYSPLVAFRTYNPSSYNALRIFCRIPSVSLYPDIKIQKQNTLMKKLASEVIEAISPGLSLCQESGVIKGACGQVPLDFYPCLPETSHKQIYNYFRDNLSSADRLLCILRIPSKAARLQVLRLLGFPSETSQGLTINRQANFF